MRIFKLVTFDITNTLLQFRIPPSQQYVRTAGIYGINVEFEDLNSSFKEQWKQLNNENPNFGASKGESSQNWWLEFVRRAFVGAGCSPDDHRLPMVGRKLYKMYATDECWKVAPDAVETLNTLKANNVKLGVISNFDDRLETILVNMKLHQWFDFVICSYTAGYMKPQREIFDLALRSCAEPVEAAEALHVGDDVKLDYFAARKAGWQAGVLRTPKNASILYGFQISYMLNSIKDVVELALRQNKVACG